MFKRGLFREVILIKNYLRILDYNRNSYGRNCSDCFISRLKKALLLTPALPTKDIRCRILFYWFHVSFTYVFCWLFILQLPILLWILSFVSNIEHAWTIQSIHEHPLYMLENVNLYERHCKEKGTASRTQWWILPKIFSYHFSVVQLINNSSWF